MCIMKLYLYCSACTYGDRYKYKSDTLSSLLLVLSQLLNILAAVAGTAGVNSFPSSLLDAAVGTVAGAIVGVAGLLAPAPSAIPPCKKPSSCPLHHHYWLYRKENLLRIF